MWSIAWSMDGFWRKADFWTMDLSILIDSQIRFHFSSGDYFDHPRIFFEWSRVRYSFRHQFRSLYESSCCFFSTFFSVITICKRKQKQRLTLDVIQVIVFVSKFHTNITTSELWGKCSNPMCVEWLSVRIWWFVGIFPLNFVLCAINHRQALTKWYWQLLR